MSILYAILAALVTGSISAVISKLKLRKSEKKIIKLQEALKAITLKCAAYENAFEEEKKSHEQTIANYQNHITVLEAIENDKQDSEVSGNIATADDESRLSFLHDYKI